MAFQRVSGIVNGKVWLTFSGVNMFKCSYVSWKYNVAINNFKTENKVIKSCWFYCVVWNNMFFQGFIAQKGLKNTSLKQETEQCAHVPFRQGDIAALFKTPPAAALNIFQCDSLRIAGTSCLIMAIVILSSTLPVLCSRPQYANLWITTPKEKKKKLNNDS